MDIHQIEIVLSVAKSKSFSEASYDNYCSLSNISKKVAAFEQELGVRIFERSGRQKVELTPCGEKLIPDLEQIVKNTDKLWAHVRSLLNIQNNKLVIACPNGLSTFGEDKAIVEFVYRNSEIIVDTITANKEPVLKLLVRDEADVAFCRLTGERLVNKGVLNILELSMLNLRMLLKEDHPGIENGYVDLSKLKDEVFIFRNMGATGNMEKDTNLKQFIHACEEEGFTPKIRFVNMRASAVFQMAEAGIGVVPLMYPPQGVIPGTVFLPLKKTYFANTLAICWKKTNRSPALQKFINFMRQKREL